MNYIVRIELQRVQTFLFAVPRLSDIIGANALLGEAIRYMLPRLAQSCGSQKPENFPENLATEIKDDPITHTFPANNEIIKNKDNLIESNDQDLQTAKKSGLESALLDRLELTVTRIEAMADGLKQVAALEDLIGKTTERG